MCVSSYFVKSADTADEVELSSLVEAGHLESAWSATFSLSYEWMIASYILEVDKLIVRRALQVKKICVPVPFTGSCDEYHEVLPTLSA